MKCNLAIDYGQSLEQMIAAGYYDWKNDNITAKRFPVVGDGVVQFEAQYFHFNRKISSEDAIREIERADEGKPWMPAKIEHLLAFGVSYPEEQRKFPIVGLGSVMRVGGDRGVPNLCGDGSNRRLGFRWGDGNWRSRYRFLSVRKVSVA